MRPLEMIGKVRAIVLCTGLLNCASSSKLISAGGVLQPRASAAGLLPSKREIAFRMLMLKNALRWYDHKLLTAPYWTQMITNGPLWAAGDLSAQWMENSRRKTKKPIDWMRVARFSAYGFCVAGPIFAWWYGYIERRFVYLKLRGNWNKYLAAKIGADQFLFEPLYLLQFFGTMGVLKGSSAQEIKELVEEEYVNTFVIDTMVWPIVQAVNFRYVPGRFQAIYVNVISLGWAGFLSLVTNPSSPEEHGFHGSSRAAEALKKA